VSEDQETNNPAAGAPGASGASSGPPSSSPQPQAFNVQLPPINVEALAKTPWVLGAASILIGLVLYWAGSIVSAFEHDAGYDARERIVHILGAGNAAWAVAVLLAVALLVLGSTGEGKPAATTSFVYQMLMLAAALITVSSAINAVIELTRIGSSFDFALYSFLEYLAGVPIAGAAAFWAWRQHPVALPGQAKPS